MDDWQWRALRVGLTRLLRADPALCDIVAVRLIGHLDPLTGPAVIAALIDIADATRRRLASQAP